MANPAESLVTGVLPAADGGAAGSPGGTGSDRSNRAGRGRHDRYASWWYSVPAIALIVVLHYIAIGAGALYAFTDSTGIGGWSFTGLRNFTEIFSSRQNADALLHTLIIAFAFLIVTSVLGLGLALTLNRQLKTRNVLRVAVFGTVVLSPLAVSYIWKFIFDPLGPLNQLLGDIGLDEWQRTWLGDPKTAIFSILVVMVWQNVGLTMVVYLAGLANVPIEVEEAAAIDGAGTPQRFRHVVLPLLRPAITVASTLLLINGLRTFDQVLALTDGGPYGASETLSTAVYKETFVNGRYGYGAALSLVLTVLIVGVTLVQNLILKPRED
jgi:raffinose/stachyose/melibiose transport system permease protein